MKITEIAFTCYPVTDVARAKAFYENVLGLTCTMDHPVEDGSGHWLEFDIGHGTLALGKMEGWHSTPQQGGTVGLEVDDFEKALEKVKAANVPITMGPFETPVCHMVMIADPDGNPLTLHKRKPGHH